MKQIIASLYQAVRNIVPARWNITLEYLRVYGRLPNLDQPGTFSEKILSRALYDRDPRLTELVDKIKVKEFVAKKFGERYTVPVLGVWESAAALDFTKPPLSEPPYALKTNHASGTNLFVKANDGSFHPEAIRKKMARYLRINQADICEEWAYAGVPRRIFAEPYIENPEGYLADYKFHVFAGKVHAVEVVIDRFRNYGVGFYDSGWKPLDIGYQKRYPRHKGVIAAPTKLAEMIKLAEAIGADFSYVRVDLYDANGQVKVGELTFYPGGGYDRFEPSEWDVTFGRLWKQNWTGPALRQKEAA